MAVWDKFLSERDREHTELFWGKQRPFGLGTKPALLVIDNIYSILGPRQPLLDAAGMVPASCGLEGWDAIDRTVDLIAAARDNGVPVIYAKLRYDIGESVALANGVRPKPAFERLPDWMVERWPEIVEEIAPQPGDVVIEKHSASMFASTPLWAHLTAIGADTVICCGNSTSGCVRATVVDAGACKLKVGVVEECTFDRTEASHAMSLFDMHQKYADVMSLDETVAYFASVRAKEAVPA